MEFFKDLYPEILIHADYPTILNYCACSKATRKLYNDKQFWAQYVKTRYPKFEFKYESDPRRIAKVLEEQKENTEIFDAPTSPDEYIFAYGLGLNSKNPKIQRLCHKLEAIWHNFDELVDYIDDEGFHLDDNHLLFPVVPKVLLSYNIGRVREEWWYSEEDREKTDQIKDSLLQLNNNMLKIIVELESDTSELYLIEQINRKKEYKDVIYNSLKNILFKYVTSATLNELYGKILIVLDEILNLATLQSGLWYLYSRR